MTTTNIKWRLDQAAKQLDDLEQEVRQQNKANHCLIKKALAEFNLHIPSSHALSGCKESCSLFCKCSPELYANEKQERHALYMRYFDLRGAAQKLLHDNEQLGLMIANTKRQPFQLAKKPKPQRRKPLVAREEQLEMQL